VVLFQVSPFDVVSFAGASAVLTAAAFLAAWVPARRAGRIEPWKAIANP
jgi:ABC-type lipoprotein release transport system permease subunit